MLNIFQPGRAPLLRLSGVFFSEFMMFYDTPHIFISSHFEQRTEGKLFLEAAYLFILLSPESYISSMFRSRIPFCR